MYLQPKNLTGEKPNSFFTYSRIKDMGQLFKERHKMWKVREDLFRLTKLAFSTRRRWGVFKFQNPLFVHLEMVQCSPKSRGILAKVLRSTISHGWWLCANGGIAEGQSVPSPTEDYLYSLHLLGQTPQLAGYYGKNEHVNISISLPRYETLGIEAF